MPVATIDIGTNTVLLLVAERREGALVAVEEHATITRLGRGVDKTRALAEDAIAETTACLARYAERVRACGATAVDIVGTSAMRDASGGEAIVEACRGLFGVPARVLSGEEEARATFRGALSGMADVGREVVVFDIGGGSTEIVLGAPGGATKEARSYDVGSVRLTERISPSDPPTTAELEATQRLAEELLEGVTKAPDEASCVGIAGTMTTLCAVHLGLEPYVGARVHGATMSVGEIEAVVTRLARLPLAERRRVAGLDEKRADVIVAGGVLALAVLRRLGKSQVRVSDRGVRWGLAEALVTKPG